MIESNRTAGITKYLDSPSQVFNRLKDETLLFFDTETTGLNPHQCQLTEIAAQVVRGPSFEVIDSFDRKIDLNEKTLNKIKEESEGHKDPKKMTVEQILKMNRYHDNTKKSESEDKVLNDFYDFCKKYNPIIVAQNAKFDLDFVNTRGDKKIPNKGVYDTMLMARYWFIPAVKTLSEKDVLKEKIRSRIITDDKGKIRSTLGNLIKAFAEKISGWHRAIDDVKSTVKAFQKIMNYFEEYKDVHEEDKYKSEMGKALRRQKEVTMTPGKKKWLEKQRGKKLEYKYASSIVSALDLLADKLEFKGYTKKACQLDILSNSIESFIR